MRAIARAIVAPALFIVSFGVASAQDRHDPQAVAVLEAMEAHLDSMQTFTIEAESFLDHEIDRVVLISNPSTSTISVDRSGKLHSRTVGLLRTTDLYLNNGRMTVYHDDSNFYAHTDTPAELSDAMTFALDQHDVETPLFDLLLLSALEYLVSDEELIIYITESSPIRGVECHQLVISGPHADMQLWIENSGNPVPRRMLMTYKAEFGRPRHDVFMNWRSGADASAFEFTPPAGATEIQFASAD